jgi:hypothetical protein
MLNSHSALWVWCLNVSTREGRDALVSHKDHWCLGHLGALFHCHQSQFVFLKRPQRRISKRWACVHVWCSTKVTTSARIYWHRCECVLLSVANVGVPTRCLCLASSCHSHQLSSKVSSNLRGGFPKLAVCPRGPCFSGFPSRSSVGSCLG